MYDRLIGIRSKIERAKHHFIDMERDIRAFGDSNPYLVGVKRNPNTRELIYYLRSAEVTPTSILLTAGDTLHNLRSSLDHLVWQLIESNGGIPPKDAGYPIFKNAASYKAGSKAKVKGLSSAALAIIDATKPYNGGDDRLWVLHRLDNIDKHRFLITAGALAFAVEWKDATKAIAELFPGGPPGQLLLNMQKLDASRRDRPLKVGDHLFVDAPDAKVNNDMKFSFTVAIYEPQVVNGEPLLESVKQLIDSVDGIINQFVPFL